MNRRVKGEVMWEDKREQGVSPEGREGGRVMVEMKSLSGSFLVMFREGGQ